MQEGSPPEPLKVLVRIECRLPPCHFQKPLMSWIAACGLSRIEWNPAICSMFKAVVRCKAISSAQLAAHLRTSRSTLTSILASGAASRLTLHHSNSGTLTSKERSDHHLPRWKAKAVSHVRKHHNLSLIGLHQILSALSDSDVTIE